MNTSSKFYAETSIIDKAAVDWEKLDAGTFGKQALDNFREPLEHQLNAINAAQNHFQNHNRGKLIMACGSGKTYTSLKIAEKIFPRGKILSQIFTASCTCAAIARNLVRS